MSIAAASLVTIACSQPEEFRAVAGQDAASSLIPKIDGGTDDAGAAADGGVVTSGDTGSADGADAPPVVSSDDASTDGVDPDGGASSGDGSVGPTSDDAAPDAAATPDTREADAEAPLDGPLAQDVGGNDDTAPNIDAATDSSSEPDVNDAGAAIPDAGPETPAAPTAICINAGGPTVEPCRADFGYTGGSSRSHPGSVDVSRVTDPAPAAVYETARVGTFTYAVSGLPPGSAHLVRLHFVEAYATGRGQRVCDVTSGAVAVLTRFDIFAAAGGANIVTIQERTLSADASGRINLSFARASSGSSSCLVSAIEVR